MSLLIVALLLFQGISNHITDSFTKEDSFLHITEVLLRENPKRVLLPRGLQKKASQAQVIGTQKDFYIRDLSKTATWKSRPFELLFNSELCRIWIDVEDFSYVQEKQTITEIRDQLEIFLTQSTSSYSISPEKGILSIVNEMYGEIPDPDSDNKIDILLLNILEPQGVNGTIAGYFDPNDLSDDPNSNRADMLYIDIYPLIYLSPLSSTVSVSKAAGTIAHELQHLILQGYKGNNQEEIFLNEGLSELSEILCGFEPRSAESFFSSASRPLFSWNYSNALPDYSRASLWFHYVYEQIGSEWLHSYIQNSKTGLPHYFSALKQQDVSFTQLWKTWFLALLNREKNLSISPYKDLRRKQLGGINPIELNAGFFTQTNGAYQFRFNAAKHTTELEVESSAEMHTHYSIEKEDLTYTQDVKRMGKREKFRLQELDYVEWVQFWEVNPDTSDIQSSIFLSKSKSEQIAHVGSGSLTNFSFFATHLTLQNDLKKIGLLFPVQELQTITAVGFSGLFENEFQNSSVGLEVPRDYTIRVFPVKNGIIQAEPIEQWENRVSRREFGNAAMEWIPFSQAYEPALHGVSELFIEVFSSSDQNTLNIGMQGDGITSVWITDENWNSEVFKNTSLHTLSFLGFPLDERVIPLIALKQEAQIPEIPVQLIAARNGKFIQLSLDSPFLYAMDITQFVLKKPDGSIQALSFMEEDEHKLEPFELVEEGHYEAIMTYRNGSNSYVTKQDWIFPKSSSFVLNKVFPNPFNPNTAIELSLLAKANTIKLNVYDVLGRQVKQDSYPTMEAGIHQLPISLSGLASGLYFFRLELTDDAQRTEVLLSKGVLVK